LCPSSADRRGDEGRHHGHKGGQCDPIVLGNPQLPALDDEGRGIDASTPEAREQRQVIPNLGDGLVPFSGIRFGGGENFIRTHDPQLHEGALKWWSRNIPDKDTKWNRHEAECK